MLYTMKRSPNVRIELLNSLYVICVAQHRARHHALLRLTCSGHDRPLLRTQRKLFPAIPIVLESVTTGTAAESNRTARTATAWMLCMFEVRWTPTFPRRLVGPGSDTIDILYLILILVLNYLLVQSTDSISISWIRTCLYKIVIVIIVCSQ